MTCSRDRRSTLNDIRDTVRRERFSESREYRRRFRDDSEDGL